MTHLTQEDKDYLKDTLEKIRELAYEEGKAISEGYECEAMRFQILCDAEIARLKDFALRNFTEGKGVSG